MTNFNNVIGGLIGEVKWVNNKRGAYRVLEVKTCRLFLDDEKSNMEECVIFKTERGLYLRANNGCEVYGDEITISLGVAPIHAFGNTSKGKRAVRARFGELDENPIKTNYENAWYAEECNGETGEPNYAPIDFTDAELEFYRNGGEFPKDEVYSRNASRRSYNDYLTSLVNTHMVTKKWRITTRKWCVSNGVITESHRAVIVADERQEYDGPSIM